jgi:hypothetical protein
MRGVAQALGEGQIEVADGEKPKTYAAKAKPPKYRRKSGRRSYSKKTRKVTK